MKSVIRRLFQRGMPCEQVLEVLQSYLDGEVDVETAQSVAMHLSQCTNCDLESDMYRRIKDSLRSTAEPIDPIVRIKLEAYGLRVMQGEFEG